MAENVTLARRPRTSRSTRSSRSAGAPAPADLPDRPLPIGPARRPGLSAAELAALGLSLAHLGAGPQSATARRALRRLFEDSEDAGGRDEAGPGPAATTLATLTRPLDPTTARRARNLAAAITARLVVGLHYVDAGGRLSTREVEPVTCLVHGDHWYLVGWCRLRRNIRAFRFDRILAVEVTDIPARPHRADRFLPFQPRSR